MPERSPPARIEHGREGIRFNPDARGLRDRSRCARRWAPTAAPSPASAPTTSPRTRSPPSSSAAASTRSGSSTSTSAPPTSRARTTATSPGWRRCSPACRRASPGATVNRLCASGLEAVNSAARAVKAGEGDFYLAGGVESMSRAPWVVEKPERGLPRGPQTMHDTTLGWRMINPRMAELGVSTESMGETGENVAERYGDQPRGPGRLRPAQPPARGRRRRERAGFAEEIVPIEAPKGRRETVLVEADEGPRPDASRRSWRSCARSSARAAPSPPATPRPSTTAPPAC